MKRDQKMITDDHIYEIAAAIQSISKGGVHGPIGLEGLTMVIGNKPGGLTVVDALYSISTSISDLANAIRETK